VARTTHLDIVHTFDLQRCGALPLSRIALQVNGAVDLMTDGVTHTNTHTFVFHRVCRRLQKKSSSGRRSAWSSRSRRWCSRTRRWFSSTPIRKSSTRTLRSTRASRATLSGARPVRPRPAEWRRRAPGGVARRMTAPIPLPSTMFRRRTQQQRKGTATAGRYRTER